MKKTKQSWKALIMLQFAVLIYTFAGIFGQLASGYPVLSLPFIGLYAAEVVVLGIYAILWQQVIRHIDLSVAYA
ncbi:MAG: transporter, partial [Oscillospiraceae bacterium]|nr:transporter [Oscillospiraceae bacterium]